jgi:GTP-binding protein
LQEFDTSMINWAVDAKMPVHILLTKSDKLKRGATKNTLLAVQKHLKDARVDDLVTVQCFSSLKAEGMKELEKVLGCWLADENLMDEAATGDDKTDDQA